MNQNQCKANGGTWRDNRCKNIKSIKLKKQQNFSPFRLIGSYIGIAIGILIALMLRFENVIWGFPNILPCSGDCWRAINYTNIIYLSVIGFIIGCLAHIVLTRYKDRRTVMVVSSVLGVIILGLLIFKGGDFLSFMSGEMKREIAPKSCDNFLVGIEQTSIVEDLRISNNVNPQRIKVEKPSMYGYKNWDVNSLLWVINKNNIRCINKMSNTPYGNTNGCAIAYNYCTPIHIIKYNQNKYTSGLNINFNSRAFISNSREIGLIFNKIGVNIPIIIPLHNYNSIIKGKNQVIVYLSELNEKGRYTGYFIDLETHARLSDNTMVVGI